LVNQGSPECIEIWNLVFIQFNANADGSFSPLPAKHVDTGMGLDRVTSFLQCTKNFTDFSRVVSNYETDAFRPIFDKLEKLSGKKYSSSLPSAKRVVDEKETPTPANESETIDVAFRVIADHIRMVSFAIADGVEPGLCRFRAEIDDIGDQRLVRARIGFVEKLIVPGQAGNAHLAQRQRDLAGNIERARARRFRRLHAVTCPLRHLTAPGPTGIRCRARLRRGDAKPLFIQLKAVFLTLC